MKYHIPDSLPYLPSSPRKSVLMMLWREFQASNPAQKTTGETSYFRLILESTFDSSLSRRIVPEIPQKLIDMVERDPMSEAVSRHVIEWIFHFTPGKKYGRGAQ